MLVNMRHLFDVRLGVSIERVDTPILDGVFDFYRRLAPRLPTGAVESIIVWGLGKIHLILLIVRSASKWGYWSKNKRKTPVIVQAQHDSAADATQSDPTWLMSSRNPQSAKNLSSREIQSGEAKVEGRF